MRWPYWQGLLGVGLGELPLSHPGNSRFAYSPGPTWGLGGSVKWLMTYGTEPGAFAILKGKLSSVPSELICAPRVVPVSPGRPPAPGAQGWVCSVGAWVVWWLCPCHPGERNRYGCRCGRRDKQFLPAQADGRAVRGLWR
jgi:hypothetical protein